MGFFSRISENHKAKKAEAKQQKIQELRDAMLAWQTEYRELVDRSKSILPDLLKMSPFDSTIFCSFRILFDRSSVVAVQLVESSGRRCYLTFDESHRMISVGGSVEQWHIPLDRNEVCAALSYILPQFDAASVSSTGGRISVDSVFDTYYTDTKQPSYYILSRPDVPGEYAHLLDSDKALMDLFIQPEDVAGLAEPVRGYLENVCKIWDSMFFPANIRIQRSSVDHWKGKIKSVLEKME